MRSGDRGKQFRLLLFGFEVGGEAFFGDFCEATREAGMVGRRRYKDTNIWAEGYNDSNQTIQTIDRARSKEGCPHKKATPQWRGEGGEKEE